MSSSGTVLPRFFITGGTLPRDAACYIRRQADERLHSALCRGDICYALTPRQMGKSSLMVQTAARLRKKQISVALLDLTAFGQNVTPDQWYNGLIGRIGQQLGLEDELEDYWNSHLHLGPFQRWSSAMREVVLKLRAGRVVIFIDEIDAVRSLPFSTDEFFAGIRHFYNIRTSDPELDRLTFCLLGVATPSDLIRDTRTTPFNIGVRVELSDFTVEEAAPLGQGLSVAPVRGQELVRRVLYWTGGHPYLTQRLCEAISLSPALSPAAVDRACNELFLSHRAREKDDNLLFVRERMLRNESDLAALLLLYGKVRAGSRVRDDETNPLVTTLRLAGIVRVEDGYLKVRNRIYADVFDKNWVTESMPGAEIRRQRAAYYRGLKIAGAAFIPMILLGAYLGYQHEFKTNTAPPSYNYDLKPPAFWASFSTQALPTAESGALLIQAGEGDISVFLNGAQYGRTERTGILQVPVLPPGDYDVRLEKPGFQVISQRAQVSAQQETRLNFKLSPMSQVAIEDTVLISQAPPGTRVTIDGKVAGVTSGNGELSMKAQPGEHEIALEKAGYVARTLRTRVSPGSNVIDGNLVLDREPLDLTAAMQSNDLSRLQEFLNQYPNSKSTSQVRSKMEDLEWARLDRSDPAQVQRFLDKYPNGHLAADARELSNQLQRDDLDWHSAEGSNTVESLQGFLVNHPTSRHVAEANSIITAYKDRQQIGQLLQAYQDSYNHQDLKQLQQLWPSCPASSLTTLFREKRAGVLSLSPKGQPVVKGDIASVTVSIRRQTDTGDSVGNVPFQFRRQNDHWIIERGSI